MGEQANRHELSGVKRRQGPGAGPWKFLSVVLAALLVGVLFLKRPPAAEVADAPAVPAEVPPEVGVEAVPPPMPTPVDPAPAPVVPSVTRVVSGVDVQKLSKDIDLKITFDASEGGLASVERKDRESYQADYTLRLRIPSAAQSREEILESNSKLLEILPGFESMLPEAAVSPWYGQLYQNKADRMKRNLSRLDELLTRHNFYDCQTMLNLVHPEKSRKVFFLQAEMDVVSDGSDGDRLPEMPDEIVNSTHYQPFTSYGWPKQSDVPNPMVDGWMKRIGNAEREIAAPGTKNDRKKWLRDRIKYLKRGIDDMKSRSYLVADYDPFVVMPVNIITDRQDAFAPNVGDYVAVIYGKKVYPAIVGDGGPTFKVGEGSLRLAKEIDARSSPYRRPVSDLTVTYVVFPRTAEIPWRAPDYEHWQSRVAELLDEVGGLGEGYELHTWKDLFPQPEPEEPTPDVEGETASEES